MSGGANEGWITVEINPAITGTTERTGELRFLHREGTGERSLQQEFVTRWADGRVTWEWRDVPTVKVGVEGA
jgi:hypothetical protein